jgi:hypothetical protein
LTRWVDGEPHAFTFATRVLSPTAAASDSRWALACVGFKFVEVRSLTRCQICQAPSISGEAAMTGADWWAQRGNVCVYHLRNVSYVEGGHRTGWWRLTVR